MTSGISFFKLTLDEWKKLGWLTAVQALVFILAVPFRLLLTFAMEKNMGRTSFEVILYANVGFEKTSCTVMIVLAGIFCALAVFGYLHSREKLDFYYSLAIRREALFLVRFAAGTMTFVAAYLASQVLAVLVGALYGAISAAVIQEIVVSCILGILFFLTSYSAAALAVLLTGKTLTSVLAIVTLALYLPLLVFVVSGYQELFLPTLIDGRTWNSGVLWLPGIFQNYGLSHDFLMDHSSPWMLILTWRAAGESVRQGLTGMWPDMGSVCMFVVLPAVTTALDLALCRVRRTEAAEKALAFGWTEGLIKILLAVPAALLVGMVFYNEFDSPVWEICFVVLFGVLACVIMEFIYRWDLRRALAHKWHIVVTVAVSLTVFLLFRFDFTGINSWLPDQEDLAAMSMRHPYGEFYYYDEDGNRLEEEQDILRLLETDRIDLLYPLAENGIQNVKRKHYDGYYSGVNMEYRLKSGKTVCRSYTVDLDLYESAVRELMKDEEYRKKYYPILSWDGEKLEQLNYVWLLLPEKFRESLEETGQGGGDQEPQEEMEPDSEPDSAGGEKSGAAEDAADGYAPVPGVADGLAPGIEIAAKDAELYDNEEMTMVEIAAEDAELYDNAGMTMGDADVMVGMTLSRAQSIRLIRAYQEDLMESDGLFSNEDLVGTISVNWRNQQEDAFQEQYTLRGDFTRTIEVLREAVAEEIRADTNSNS